MSFVVYGLASIYRGTVPAAAGLLQTKLGQLHRAAGIVAIAHTDYALSAEVHAGSLPRPAELTRLYIDRGQGKPVDTDELARGGREATRASIRQQADAGIDIGNNGEQPRDSFFLYLRDRLTGLGGSWERPTRADVERYPAFKRRWAQQASSEDKVSNVSGVPRRWVALKSTMRVRCVVGMA